MPANLTHDYRKAEEEYRRAQSPAEQVACLEHMLAVIPKHKGTEHLQADLKTRLKEARADAQTEKKSGGKGRSYRIPRQGAGTVVLIGGPNAGKSRIVAELTNADPEVAAWPFTTREPLPAMMPCGGALVQLIDTPPVTDAHLEPYLINYVRSADLVLLCVDGSSDDSPAETLDVLQQFETRKTTLAAQTGFDEDDLTRLQIRTLLVVTRRDEGDSPARIELLRELLPRELPVLSVEMIDEESRETLRQRIWKELDVIRVYTKPPNKPAKYEDPFTIRRGGTIEDLALRVHRELASKLKFARVWGESVHDGQSVGRDHPLAEGDMVELHS